MNFNLPFTYLLLSGVCKKQSSLGYSTFDYKSFKLEADKKVIMSRLTDSDTDMTIQILAVISDCTVGYRHKV